MNPASPSTPYLSKSVVVGPAAIGKSALAPDFAERVYSDEPVTRAEIINAGASLLYRGMDIGTAKPSPTERARIPHHQIDVLIVRGGAFVAAFQCSARGGIDAVEPRGHLPVIARGSDLYVRALIDDLDLPGTDPAVRNRLNERAEWEGAAALHVELTRLDPIATERVEASNTCKIARVLEVIETIGRPFSTSLPRCEDAAPIVHIVLRCKHRLLDKHIDERARAMLDGGLVGEAEALIDQGILEGEIAPCVIDYAQVLTTIDGTMSVPEAVDSTVLITRQLASRQIKQFRRGPRLYWISIALTETGQCTGSECSRLTRQAWELVYTRRGAAQVRNHAVLDRSSRS